MSEFFRKSLYRPSAPRLLQVKRRTSISPGLLCLTLTGEGLSSFPEYCPAAHVKLFLAHPGQTQPVLPTLGPDGPIWPSGERKPVVRTYSVRSFRLKDLEMDIEFAMHGVEGPATRFAKNAVPGDYVGLSYPGGPDPMIPEAKYYYLAGDLSSLPALTAILEHLPDDSQGTALIRIDDAQDMRELRCPCDMRVQWIVGDISKTHELVAAFRLLPLTTQNAFYWIGGEHTLVVSLRKYLTSECGVSKDSLYALPYWRHNFDEEGYHLMREDVMNQES